MFSTFCLMDFFLLFGRSPKHSILAIAAETCALSPSSPVVGSVARAGAKVEDGVTLEVEDGGLGRHEAKHGTEVGGVGTPGHVVDWPLLGCLDPHTHKW